MRKAVVPFQPGPRASRGASRGTRPSTTGAAGTAATGPPGPAGMTSRTGILARAPMAMAASVQAASAAPRRSEMVGNPLKLTKHLRGRRHRKTIVGARGHEVGPGQRIEHRHRLVEHQQLRPAGTARVQSRSARPAVALAGAAGCHDVQAAPSVPRPREETAADGASGAGKGARVRAAASRRSGWGSRGDPRQSALRPGQQRHPVGVGERLVAHGPGRRAASVQNGAPGGARHRYDDAAMPGTSVTS